MKTFQYDQFTDKKILGEGRFNQVYVANHPQVGKCIVKIVSRSFLDGPRQKARLCDEIRELHRIQHDRILRVYGYVIERDHLCIVYEYTRNGALFDALRRIKLTWPLKIRIAYEVGLALNFLHHLPESQAGPLVHQNLKSTNVLLDLDFHVKVADFVKPGFSTWTELAAEQLSRTEQRQRVKGSYVPALERPGYAVAYLPPEGIRDMNLKAEPSFDAYSFGVILWELLANCIPYRGMTRQQVYNRVNIDRKFLPTDEIQAERPQVLFDIMTDCLKENPVHRPAIEGKEAVAENSLPKSSRDELVQMKDIVKSIDPLQREFSEAAKDDAISCNHQYDQYRMLKRKQMAEKAKVDAAPRAFEEPQWERDVTRHDAVPPSDDLTTNTITLRPSETSRMAYQPSGDLATTSFTTVTLHPDDNKQRGAMGAHVEESSEVLNKAEPFTDDDPTMTAAARQLSSGTVAEYPVPAQSCHRIVTIDDMHLVAKNMDREWKKFARKLLYSDTYVEHIDYNFAKEGLHEKVYQSILKWKEQMGDKATVATLATVLVETDFRHIAAELPAEAGRNNSISGPLRSP